MKEFKEYLEQVGLRGQSATIGAKKMADKLGETLESRTLIVNLVMDATKGEIEVK